MAKLAESKGTEADSQSQTGRLESPSFAPRAAACTRATRATGLRFTATRHWHRRQHKRQDDE